MSSSLSLKMSYRQKWSGSNGFTCVSNSSFPVPRLTRRLIISNTTKATWKGIKCSLLLHFKFTGYKFNCFATFNLRLILWQMNVKWAVHSLLWRNKNHLVTMKLLNILVQMEWLMILPSDLEAIVLYPNKRAWPFLKFRRRGEGKVPVPLTAAWTRDVLLLAHSSQQSTRVWIICLSATHSAG